MTDPIPALQRMQTLATQWTQASDRRAIFLDCYRLMTSNTLSAIEAKEFHDPAWVHRLLERFADYYFDAAQSYEQASPTLTPVWRIAHDAAREPKTMTLQNLLLGINAHINYDLVLTLVDLLAPEWEGLTEGQRLKRYSDHCHVNNIIARTIDEVQDTVVEHHTPILDIIDKLLGPVDEWMASRLLANWREEVWRQATKWLEVQDREHREGLRQQIEEAALKRAQAILVRRRPGHLRQLLGRR